MEISYNSSYFGITAVNSISTATPRPRLASMQVREGRFSPNVSFQIELRYFGLSFKSAR